LYGVEETIAGKDFNSQTKPTLILKMQFRTWKITQLRWKSIGHA
jgi:hypothetical protein